MLKILSFRTQFASFCFIFLFFFLFPQKVFAGDVVINEFLVDPDVSQWVELYNKGTAPIDISGWFIDDSGGTQKYTIEQNTIIGQGEFKVFESGLFNLNRTTPDTIRLLNGSTIEDSYSYDTGPGPNNTYGRQTDGIGSFVVFTSPTKESSNNTSSPAPTATPTSTPTPSPTSTPTPAPTSTPKPKLSKTTVILSGLGVIIITLIGVLAFRSFITAKRDPASQDKRHE